MLASGGPSSLILSGLSSEPFVSTPVPRFRHALLLQWLQ
jgi:hypothetical protein